MPSYHRETTSTLTSGASYTGQIHNLINDNYLLAFVFSDVSGDVFIEQSPDRTHWYQMEDAQVQANDPTPIVSEAVCQYGRVYYENGAQSQNTFRFFACRKEER